MKTIRCKPYLLALIILAILVLLAGMAFVYLTTRTASRTGKLRAAAVVYQSGLDYLVIEALDDDLLHFEFSSQVSAPSPDQPIYTTPMVFKTDYPGPQRFINNGRGALETNDLKVQVDTSTLCVTVTDKTRKPSLVLTTTCPTNVLPGTKKVLTLTQEGTRYVYGLGEQFVTPDAGSLNWVGQQRTPGNDYGNAMGSFFGGYVGNAQFPILYALTEQGENYALFVDSLYAQTWNFVRNPWEMRTQGNALRWYVLSGPNLPDLRQDFMELVGRPLVPPKMMFGLWISEYGFDNWAELEDKLQTLRADAFPVDGFVMDLQWFGNITPIENSHMGGLTWDTQNFPDPAGKIASLWEQGIGLMTIEESYVVQRLPEFADMGSRGYLVRKCEGCEPTIIVSNWWGTGGMVDWTNPSGSDYWHDLKRQPLIDMGIIGHWTDLGEPEMFNSDAYYYDFPEFGYHGQADVHNIYNFRWSESIARGYDRNHVSRRPFILSRSGTAGIQRFGTNMWSGDIGTNLLSLAAHLNVQAHMSLSGMDYFGSDIGGFHRGTAGDNLDEIYTKWFAMATLTDLPVRPHTENLCNCKETAPDRVGDLKSNLANLRLRYALSPYRYSLAYRAYLYGEPVLPPLVYYFQNDPNVREMSDEKLLGPDLLIAVITQLSETQRDVYLPAGTWVDYYTNEWTDSHGMWLRGVSALREGLFRLPLYARAGAILPMMYVDDKTMNILGLRSDGTLRDELIVRVYADPEQTPSSFTLYEDDGQTIAYQQGQTRTTFLSQQQLGDRVTVTIEAASGTYEGAPTRRDHVIQLIVTQGVATSVTLNGETLPEWKTQAEFEAASQGWYNAGNNLILAKSGKMDVKIKKTFEFTLTR